MPTKQSPGIFDCYRAAMIDEPIFTILGRDPAGPATLRFWVEERGRLGKVVSDEDRARMGAALDEATEMLAWRDQFLDADGEGTPLWKMDRATSEGNPIRIDAEPLGDPVGMRDALEELLRLENGATAQRSPGAHSTHLKRDALIRAMIQAIDNRQPVVVTRLLTGEIDPPASYTPDTAGLLLAVGAILSRPVEDANRLHFAKRCLDEADAIVPGLSSQIREGLLQDQPVDHGELAGTCDCSAGYSGASDHAPSCPSYVRPTRMEPALGMGYDGKESWTGDPYKIMADFLGIDRERVKRDILAIGYSNPESEDDLAHLPEFPAHRFAAFHKGERYAYARGLEVSPIHLPRVLDRMSADGWEVAGVFGQTDSANIGFLFRRFPEVLNQIELSGQAPATVAAMIRATGIEGRQRPRHVEIPASVDAEIEVHITTRTPEHANTVAQRLRTLLNTSWPRPVRIVGLIDGRNDRFLDLVCQDGCQEWDRGNGLEP